MKEPQVFCPDIYGRQHGSDAIAPAGSSSVAENLAGPRKDEGCWRFVLVAHWFRRRMLDPGDMKETQGHDQPYANRVAGSASTVDLKQGRSIGTVRSSRTDAFKQIWSTGTAAR